MSNEELTTEQTADAAAEIPAEETAPDASARFI